MAAVLLALVVAMASNIIGDSLVKPEELKQNVFVVEGITPQVADGGDKITVHEIESIEPLLAKADLEKGKVIAKKCAQCHTFNKDGPNRVGPNLYGVVGRQVAQAAGFAYSKAMSSFKETWSIDHLNKYLYKPKDYVKGTKMQFVGIVKAEDRANLIVYMNSESDKPVPLSE